MMNRQKIAGVLGCALAFLGVGLVAWSSFQSADFVPLNTVSGNRWVDSQLRKTESLNNQTARLPAVTRANNGGVANLGSESSFNQPGFQRTKFAPGSPRIVSSPQSRLNRNVENVSSHPPNRYQVKQVGFEQALDANEGETSFFNPEHHQAVSSQSKRVSNPYFDSALSSPPVTEEEMEIIRRLPPVCQSDLPGRDPVDNNSATSKIVDHSNLRPNQVPKVDVIPRATLQTTRSTELDLQATVPTPIQVENASATKVAREVAPTPVEGVQTDFEAAKSASHSNGIPESSDARYDLGSSQPSPHATVAGLPNPHSSAVRTTNKKPDGPDPHLEIYSRSAFPSAVECASCHQQIFDEWASSSHGYASISPMFHRFEDTINRLAQGTIGYFCLRCHAPVATTMGLRRDQPIWDGPRVFREGVTCVACHRVKVPYVKANGERRIEPGDIYAPVYGSGDGKGVELANKYKAYFKTKLSEQSKTPGQAIHRRVVQFEELSKSSFCMSCHQVAVQPGIKLEVVWDQYRASPAFRAGVSCQDCHMGKVPGVDEGYTYGPAAVVSERVVNPERRHSNHLFYGPGYSIAHPGIFPQNKESDRWTVNQWLQFDWRAGWGTDDFEDALEEGKVHTHFPPVWDNVDDRYDARDIVEDNLKKLAYKKDVRRQLLENGSKLDGPFFSRPPNVGMSLSFYYCITNLNPGHNMPSGSLGAQPQVWLNAVLIAPDGQRLWETGYVDSNGDLADNHSLDVLARRVPLDRQLFNLQTKFLTTNVKGTEREMYLPINVDIDQLPFIRPAAQPVTVLNHPPLIRMEGHSLAPLESRRARFTVPARLIQQPGTYRLSVRMRSRAEPIYFMRFCESTPEMERMMNEWIADFHVSTVTFEVQ